MVVLNIQRIRNNERRLNHNGNEIPYELQSHVDYRTFNKELSQTEIAIMERTFKKALRIVQPEDVCFYIPGHFHDESDTMTYNEDCTCRLCSEITKKQSKKNYKENKKRTTFRTTLIERFNHSATLSFTISSKEFTYSSPKDFDLLIDEIEKMIGEHEDVLQIFYEMDAEETLLSVSFLPIPRRTNSSSRHNRSYHLSFLTRLKTMLNMR